MPARVRPTPTIFRSPDFDPERPCAFAFLGVPSDVNTSGAPGARFGPSAIRAASDQCHYTLDTFTFEPKGFVDFSDGQTILRGITLADAGDVFVDAGQDQEQVQGRITSAVRTILEAGSVPIVLGGDHAITYPVLSAFQEEALGVIHIDAHTDLGEAEPNVVHHGCVFTVLLDKLEYVEKVYQLGLRGFVEASQDQSHERAVAFGIDQIREQTIEAIVDQTMENLPYYISLDIDVVDPAFAPSTGTPVPGGLFPHELKQLLRAVTQKRQIVGMDVVEVCSPLGEADGTAGIAVKSILTVMDGIVRFHAKALEPA